MKLKANYKNILELNLAVLFISTSGVLGKYIDLPVPITIFLRASIAGILLFIYTKIKGIKFEITRKNQISLMIGGIFLGAHWITYFYSLKLSNVAIAMLSLYTFPTITAILEPLLLRKKFQISHIVLGVMVLFGIYLIAPNLNIGDQYFIGICLGLLSALFYAIRNIILKGKGNHHNQSIVMINQLGIISFLLFPALFFFETSQVVEYMPYTILLAILTTAIGHTLFVNSLKYFSTTSASLMSSLQPIYGIILAFIFLSESPNLRTVVGGLIIISTVAIESLRIHKNAME